MINKKYVSKYCCEDISNIENYEEEWKQNISEARKGKHWKLVDDKRVWY